jgi:hypothetical protein
VLLPYQYSFDIENTVHQYNTAAATNLIRGVPPEEGGGGSGSTSQPNQEKEVGRCEQLK